MPCGRETQHKTKKKRNEFDRHVKASVAITRGYTNRTERNNTRAARDATAATTDSISRCTPLLLPRSPPSFSSSQPFSPLPCCCCCCCYCCCSYPFRPFFGPFFGLRRFFDTYPARNSMYLRDKDPTDTCHERTNTSTLVT